MLPALPQPSFRHHLKHPFFTPLINGRSLITSFNWGNICPPQTWWYTLSRLSLTTLISQFLTSSRSLVAQSSFTPPRPPPTPLSPLCIPLVTVQVLCPNVHQIPDTSHDPKHWIPTRSVLSTRHLHHKHVSHKRKSQSIQALCMSVSPLKEKLLNTAPPGLLLHSASYLLCQFLNTRPLKRMS